MRRRRQRGFRWSLSDSDALRGAFEKLPLLPDKEGELERFVEFFDQVPRVYSEHDLPPKRETSVESAEDELDTLVKLIRKLRVHIEGMHRTSLRAIETELDTVQKETGERTPEEAYPNRLAEALSKLEDVYRGARERIGVAPPDGYPPKGPPGKNQAKQTAIAAAEAYRSLTGKEPTFTTNPDTNKPGGPFLRFLREVFDALGIEARAEGYARRVVSELKRQKIPT